MAANYKYSLHDDTNLHFSRWFDDIAGLVDFLQNSPTYTYQPEKIIEIYKAQVLPVSHVYLVKDNVGEAVVESMQMEADRCFGKAGESYLADLENKHLENIEALIADYFNANIPQPDYYLLDKAEKLTITLPPLDREGE
jgi:hypothetical protein